MQSEIEQLTGASLKRTSIRVFGATCQVFHWPTAKGGLAMPNEQV